MKCNKINAVFNKPLNSSINSWNQRKKIYFIWIITENKIQYLDNLDGHIWK